MPLQSIVWADLRLSHNTPSNGELIPTSWIAAKVEKAAYVQQVTGRVLPGLVVFEFDHPDIPSLTTLRDIRRRFASIPVLMLTAYHSEALAIWALRNHVADYLVVPISQDKLIISVEEAMTIRQAENPIPDELRFRASHRHKTAAALMHVAAHYHEKMREESVASICRMSISSFSRVFRQEQGRTFREYLLNYRIGRACELLRMPGITVTDAAFTVGFNDVSHFSRMFKRQVGQTPSAFQQGNEMS